MKRGFLVALAIVATAATVLARDATATPSGGATNHPLAFVQVPAKAGPPAGRQAPRSSLALRYRAGARIVLSDVQNVAGSKQVVTDGFACATDPTWSFDGQNLTFSGQRTPSDSLQVWEVAATGSEPHQPFAVDADCVSPLYLPDGRLAFASTLSGEFEEHGPRRSFSLYAVRPGDDRPARLTFNPSSDFDPVVLPDGRLLYSSWQHVGNHHWPRGTVALMLVNSDGTGVFPLTGNHSEPWLKRGAIPFADDRIAFIRSDKFVDFGAGELVATSLNDAFAPYQVLIPADQYEVSDAAALPDGGLIVSARPRGKPEATFGLYTYKDGVVTLLYDDPNYHELRPAVGGVKTPPETLISTVEPDLSTGYVALLNCYDTDRTDQHPLRSGVVKVVRVIEGIALREDQHAAPTFLEVPGREGEPSIRPNAATGYIPARILGEVPPATDGSVYLKVPADRPLRMQLVDRDGFTIINERAWFWVRPNERRICIGCHENRELTPNNAVALAARRVPTDLTESSAWQTVTFRKDIQPILQANCAVSECHVPPKPTAGMNLTSDRLNGKLDAVLADRFGPAYANLLERQENKPFAVGGRRVHPGDSRSSPMLWMLYGRPLAPQYQPAPFDRPLGSPHPGPMLPEAQLELIRKWIDLGAQYDDESPGGPWPYPILVPSTVVMEHAPDGK